jgi:hypothetical protein
MENVIHTDKPVHEQYDLKVGETRHTAHGTRHTTHDTNRTRPTRDLRP